MQSNQQLHFVGICGSLRKRSIHRKLLQYAEQHVPGHVRFTYAELSGVPFFNEDTENPLPPAVEELKTVIASADAVVIASPEYNMTVTGVLKNAIEWLSRKSTGTPLAGKPVAIMGASTLPAGSSLGQQHLRHILFALNMQLLNRPLVLIGNVNNKIDGEGNLQDPVAQQQIQLQMKALADWTAFLKR